MQERDFLFWVNFVKNSPSLSFKMNNKILAKKRAVNKKKNTHNNKNYPTLCLLFNFRLRRSATYRWKGTQGVNKVPEKKVFVKTSDFLERYVYLVEKKEKKNRKGAKN